MKMQRFFPELRLFLNGAMNKILLFVSAFGISMSLYAQSYDSWEIYQNRKEVSKFNDKKETDDERRVVLLNRFLEGPGFFIIEFKPNQAESEWIRTMAFYDSTDKLIRDFNNTLLLRIHNSDMNAILDGRQKVKVYSWAVPKDPALAAGVKPRRLLLCTLYTR